MLTVETLRNDLQDRFGANVHGRHVHSETYLRDVISKAGLELLELTAQPIRFELGQPVGGYLVVGRKKCGEQLGRAIGMFEEEPSVWNT